MNNLIKKFNIIKLSIASPEIIRSWSFGEVKKPETINYRTFKPERDGLFCSKIFGPIKDYECICGKYKRIKYKNIVCEKCGVEIIQSKSRRERMGHIELSSPVSHIWFLKSLPSKIGLLLDISLKDVEKVLYFESYIITKSNISKFRVGQIISENNYIILSSKYKNEDLEIKIGAEAIQIILKNINLNKELSLLNKELYNNYSDSKKRKTIKRIKLIESFIHSKNKPEWMILTVLPVLPPDLRPLVPLDGGRFATSDLNDLYRRVINRNNRLKRLIDLSAPNIIIKNEKRMLQESVDSLLDNGRQDKIAITSNKRQLKSLSDMIKGKQGRFRQNLLGKRVDYSGRSVITVGPYLKLNQCGLPKKMALELFKPFIYNKLIEKGLSNNLKSSKKIVDKEQSIVWDILSDVIKDHPILLNRAPTLHRLGIQAFDPILIDGKAIQLHPLVCTAYNADFDGDQMAVHVPLSIESQLESRVLMMSTNNILSPANGDPVIIPSQDIILGLYYMTMNIENNKCEIIFSNITEAKKSYDSGITNLHSNIKIRIIEHIKINENDKYIENIFITNTTIGRIILWEIFPKGLKFELVNKCLNKKSVLDIINICYKFLGIKKTIKFIDKIMYIGFIYASKSGISVCTNDFKIPNNKFKFINNAQNEVNLIQDQYQSGLMSFKERYNKIINIWSETNEKITNEMMTELSKYNNTKNIKELLNSVFIMIDSGARGSSTQIRQLAGMRGLMTKPDGFIIETPITANFKEGLNILQYFISTHGARKGLADTALKTANSGYLTRRLVDVAQDIVITEYDCNTDCGIIINDIIENKKILEHIYDNIIGRIILSEIYDINKNLIINKNTLLNNNICNILENNLINNIKIRSVITCETEFGICSLCYGSDLSTGKIINQGESVGVIAAQSIGEPGTQLTMRTFHIGGAAFSSIIESNIISKHNGYINLDNIKIIKNKNNQNIIITKNSELYIINDDLKKIKYKIPYGSIIFKLNNDSVKIGEIIAKCDPYYTCIISEFSGIVEFVDIIENKTSISKIDELTGMHIITILDYFERSNDSKNLFPRIKITNKNIENKDNSFYYAIPDKSIIQVFDKSFINIGDVIAKIPQNTGSIKDITGGLPRVADIFEARQPKNIAILAEYDGIVSIDNFSKNKRKLSIISDKNIIIYETLIPKLKQLNVFNGDKIKKGDIISDGQESLHDILRLKGVNSLMNFIINEIQSIYRLQGVKINDKHIEIIIKQMLRKVTIIDSGDSNFKKNDQYEYIKIKKINKILEKNNKKTIKYKHNLLGITKSSLMTDSFISSASFQETTRVLTESSILGKIDFLKGLKENVIVGRLIPAGTGYSLYQSDNDNFDNFD